MEEGQFVEFHPLYSLSPSAPIEFTVSGGGAEYLDFNNTYLHVRAKITRANGVALADNTDNRPGQLLAAYSIFSSGRQSQRHPDLPQRKYLPLQGLHRIYPQPR